MPRQAGSRKQPITVTRIVDAALAIIERDGYDAVSMRAIARRLDTGQSSLYAHVPNKLELDRVLVSRLWSALPVPEPDRATWRRDLVAVYVQQAELVGRHPGIERAYLVSLPIDPPMLTFFERLLALYDAGGLRGADVLPLEATLEAIALTFGQQTVMIRQRTAALSVTADELLEDPPGGMPDLAGHPLFGAFVESSTWDEVERTANLARRLHAAIAAYVPMP